MVVVAAVVKLDCSLRKTRCFVCPKPAVLHVSRG
jgi:hypothetical protein